MKDISKAGYGLLCYVEAVLQYCVVFKEVKPKKDKVQTLEKEFETVRSYFCVYYSFRRIGGHVLIVDALLFRSPIN